MKKRPKYAIYGNVFVPLLWLRSYGLFTVMTDLEEGRCKLPNGI